MSKAGEKTGRGCWKWGCLGTVVLVTGMLLGLGRLWFWAKRTAPPCVEKFQAAIDREDYKGAYALTGQQWRTSQSYEGSVAIFQAVHACLGTCQKLDMTRLCTTKAHLVPKRLTSTSYGVQGLACGIYRTEPSLSVTGMPDVTVTVIVYDARFSNGDATLTFTVATKGDDSVIEGARYSSPLMMAALRCEHCGTINKGLGEFCSQCGKPRRRWDEKEKAPPPPPKP